MKIIKYIIIIAHIFIGCSACNLFEESGFPCKVHFPKEGGTKILTGDWYLRQCWIENLSFESDVCIDENSYKYTYDWISATIELRPTNQITLTVKANTTNKPRILRLMISDGSPPSDEIYISQD